MAALTTIEVRISSLEAEFSTIKVQIKSQFKDLDAQKAEMGLTEVVEHAKVEFVKIRSDLQAIYGNAAAAFDEMGKRIDGIEKTKTAQNKGYIPIKSLIPEDHGDGWRQWQDDLLDFLDCSNVGMRSFLKEIEAQTEELKDEWMQMICTSARVSRRSRAWRSRTSAGWWRNPRPSQGRRSHSSQSSSGE